MNPDHGPEYWLSVFVIHLSERLDAKTGWGREELRKEIAHLEVETLREMIAEGRKS